MGHPDVITTIWDDPRNIERLTSMWAEGASASEIARALGQGATRSAVIGKVHRLKLQKRDNSIRARSARTLNGEIPRKGNTGSPGQPNAFGLVHRVEGRLKAERARQEGKLSHRGQEPFRAPGRVDVDDEGVDVSHLLGGADRKIGRQCGWVHGTPGETEWGYCGKPVVEGTQWCPEHHARVYPGRAAL